MASSSSGPPPPADGYGITDEMRNRAALGLDPYGAPGGDDGGRARGAYDGVPFDDALWSTDESTKGADDRHHGSKGRRAQQQHAAPRKTQLLDGAGKISLRAAARETEPVVLAERRGHAARVLGSPELLMMHAQAAGDSIPATRLRWMRILCGYDQQAPQHDGAGADDDDDDDAQRQHDRAAGKAPAGRKAYGRGPARRTSGDRGGSGR